MQYQTSKRKRIEQQLFDAVNSSRASVLDLFEAELGDSPNWHFLRSKLLRIFGDRCLGFRINEILDAEFGGEHEQ